MSPQRPRRGRRPAGRRRRGVRRGLRPLLGAALVAAGVLIPVDSESLPRPVGDVAGSAPAQAQRTPGPPTNLQATPGDQSVTLSWDDPNDLSITGYEYQVNHNATFNSGFTGWSSWTAISGSGASTTSHTLTALPNGTALRNGREYRYKIRAVNVNGPGTPAPDASPWYVSAIPMKPPAAPTGLAATGFDQSVLLTWKNPANATILRYEFQMAQANGTWGGWQTVPSSGASTTSHTVGGLTNGTAYWFRLRAVNAAGSGAAAPAATPDYVWATPNPVTRRIEAGTPDDCATTFGSAYSEWDPATRTWADPAVADSTPLCAMETTEATVCGTDPLGNDMTKAETYAAGNPTLWGPNGRDVLYPGFCVAYHEYSISNHVAADLEAMRACNVDNVDNGNPDSPHVDPVYDPVALRGYVVRYVETIPSDDDDNDPLTDQLLDGTDDDQDGIDDDPNGEKYDPPQVATCTLLKARGCETGYPVSTDVCRSVMRRGWTCPTGYAPTNQFNTCYRPGTPPAGSHPACGTGSPDIFVMSCAGYVGGDYTDKERDGSTVLDCAAAGDDDRFWTGNSSTALADNARAGGAAKYWCQFTAKWLTIDCHRSSPTDPTCSSTDVAYCVKRVSENGGCDGIALAIRCREIFAAYEDENDKATPDEDVLRGLVDDLRDSGCQICPVLPYDATPGDCPDELLALPDDDHTVVDRDYDSPITSRYLDNATKKQEADNATTHESVHQAEADSSTACADPPAGWIEASSSHQSGLALVHSPVIVTVNDVLKEFRNTHTNDSKNSPNNKTNLGVYYFPVSTPYSGENRAFQWARWEKPDHNTYAYHPEGDKLYRVFTDGGTPADTVNDLVSGECLVDEVGDFKLIVHDLWPDLPAQHTEIKDLFGATALDWWDVLPLIEQERLTVDRGLEWLGGGSTPTPTQLADREKIQRQKHECYSVNDRDPWCRWTPTQPGYYSLVAGGSWLLHKYGPREFNDDELCVQKYSQSCGWKDIMWAFKYSNVNKSPVYPTYRDTNLARLGSLTPADLGLGPAMDGYLRYWEALGGTTVEMHNNFPSDIFQHYTTAGVPDVQVWYEEHLYKLTNEIYLCPRISPKIECTLTQTQNYTETEPLGIIVHELRTVTREPATN